MLFLEGPPSTQPTEALLMILGHPLVVEGDWQSAQSPTFFHPFRSPFSPKKLTFFPQIPGKVTRT